MQEMLSFSIFGNATLDYLTSLGIFFGGTAIVFLFKSYVLRRLIKWAESTVTTIDDLLVKVIHKSLVPIFYFGVFYISLHTLTLSAGFERGLGIAAIALITLLVARAVTAAADYALQSSLKESDDPERRESSSRGYAFLSTLSSGQLHWFSCWTISA